MSKSKDNARSLIPCPECFNGHSVVNSTRWCDPEQAIRRRRKCLTCGARFTTYETTDKALTKVAQYQKALDRIKKALLEGNRAFLRLAEYLEGSEADAENQATASREIRNSLKHLKEDIPQFTKREQKRRERLGIRGTNTDTNS